MGRRIGVCMAACACLMPLGAAPAPAATPIGQTFPPSSSLLCDPGFTRYVSVSPGNLYAAPTAGVITSWSFEAGADRPGQMRLKVARPLGGASFTTIGQSELETTVASALNTFQTRIPVQAGDIIGTFFTENGYCIRPVAGYSFSSVAGDAPPETTATYAQVNGIQLDVSALLEPDCDGDGFGDETQDQDLSPCPPGPVATITKGPKAKVKTKKKNAKVTFEFSSNEPNSTFECVLDGKQEFKACTSPLKVKVKKGKHTFSVAATDAGGNAGAAATDDFKVKRKKK